MALSGDKKKDALTLLALSEGHLADDEPEEAKRTAEQAQEIYRELKDAAGAVEALRALVLAEAACGKVDAAITKAKGALAESGSSKHGEGVLLMAMSEIEVMSQEPEDALPHAKQSLAAFESAGEKTWQAKAKLAVASAAVELDSGKEAATAAAEARALYKEAGDKLGEGAALEQLAVVYISENNTLQVIESLQAAVSIYETAGAARELGVALTSLAEVHLMEGRAVLALKLANEAWEASKAAQHPQGTAGAMAMVARASVLLGVSDQAEEKMKEEAEECKKIGNVKGEAAAMLALYQARLAAEDPEGALHLARRALVSLTAAKDAKGSARVLHSIAALEYERGYWEMAIRAAKEALSVLADIGGSLKETSALESIIAGAHDARGEEPPSSSSREKALKVMKELGSALEEQNVEAFDAALKRLNRQSAATLKDTERAFAPALEKNPKQAQEFLDKHLSEDHKVSGQTSAVDIAREPDFALRTFPARAPYEASRTDGGFEWSQTAGRMVMWYQLRDGPVPDIPGGWRQQDIEVEMSRTQLKVTVGGLAQKHLSGEFAEHIWVKRSWWVLDQETGVVEFHLIKRSLATWKSPWWQYDNILGTGPTQSTNQFRRTAFPWTKPMEQSNIAAKQGAALFADWGDRLHMSDSKQEHNLEIKLPGEISPDEGPGYQRSSFAEVFQHTSENFVCSADEICLGITLAQDEKHVFIRVHFERFRFEDVRARVPLEGLFAVDVWEREVCIFLQGDKQNPILWAELGGFCVPTATTWRITSTESMRDRQLTLGSYTPALEVALVRADSSKWHKVFLESVQHRLLPKDASDTSGKAERFEGLKDVPNLRRSGFDVNHEDFWSFVDDYVNDTIKRTGHSTVPKKLVLA